MAGAPESSGTRPGPCVLCGGDRTEPLAHDRIAGWPGALAVVRCRDCALVRVDPIPDAEAVARYYAERSLRDVDRVPDGIPGEEERLARRRARFLARLRAPGRVLDVGVGTGALLVELAERGWAVTGCDLSRPNVEDLRARRPDARVVHGGIEDVDPGPFDVVTLFHVLEHVRDPARTLAEAAARLAPGGLLVVEIPTVKRPRFRLRRRMLQNQLHLWHFERRTLAALLARAGFEPRAWSFHDHRAFPAGHRRGVLRPLRTAVATALLRLGVEIGKNLRVVAVRRG